MVLQHLHPTHRGGHPAQGVQNLLSEPMTRNATHLTLVLPALLALGVPVSAQQAAGSDTEAATPAPAAVPVTMAEIEQAWQRGDFVFVRAGLEKLATEDGSALAQFRYGRVLLEGTGGPRNPGEAVAWLEKAVAQNSAPAATLLARVYLTNGPAQDTERAAALLGNAAARGDTEAQYYLGLLLQAGTGIDQDAARAFDWFLAASEEGNALAQYELSKAYSRGLGTAQDNDAALRWLQEAAGNGLPDAQYFLANALDTGAGAPKNTKDALNWFRRAAEAGQPQAQRDLGTKYLLGAEGIEPDAAEALRWLEASAKAGDRAGMHNLAIAYTSGDVLPQDDDKAFYWYDRASTEGLARATMSLGQFYAIGRAVPQDIPKAVELFELAARQGEVRGALQLSAMAKAGTLDGIMSPHEAVTWVMIDLTQNDDPQAEEWLLQQARAGVRPALLNLGEWYLARKDKAETGAEFIQQAALAGSVPAQFRLGTLLTTGDGIALDYVEAHKWLNIAAASGHKEAAETRAVIGDLMTPEQVAQAQTAARTYFDTARSRAPQTDQIVRGAGTDTPPTEAPD